MTRQLSVSSQLESTHGVLRKHPKKALKREILLGSCFSENYHLYLKIIQWRFLKNSMSFPLRLNKLTLLRLTKGKILEGTSFRFKLEMISKNSNVFTDRGKGRLLVKHLLDAHLLSKVCSCIPMPTIYPCLDCNELMTGCSSFSLSCNLSSWHISRLPRVGGWNILRHGRSW